MLYIGFFIGFLCIIVELRSLVYLYILVTPYSSSGRTRCIDVRYKLVINMVGKERFEVGHVSTKEIMADGRPNQSRRKGET